MRESSVEEWKTAVHDMFSMLRVQSGGIRDIPLGLSVQRSSFLLWDKASGVPLTPVISWQDRRALPWVLAHADQRDAFKVRTGLELTAHYAGPKLAVLIDSDPELQARMEAGAVLFGNLDSWVGAWSDVANHETDLTMAARSGLVDIETGDWGRDLLGLFGVSRACLPEIRPTMRHGGVVQGDFLLRASLADQAGAWLAHAFGDNALVLVSLGTGGFVLAAAESGQRVAGYLTAPVGDSAVLEGTVNGVASALARSDLPPADWPARTRAKWQRRI